MYDDAYLTMSDATIQIIFKKFQFGHFCMGYFLYMLYYYFLSYIDDDKSLNDQNKFMISSYTFTKTYL